MNISQQVRLLPAITFSSVDKYPAALCIFTLDTLILISEFITAIRSGREFARLKQTKRSNTYDR